MTKAWLIARSYDGGWYGVLIQVRSQIILHEGELRITYLAAVGDMERYAKSHNIEIVGEL